MNDDKKICFIMCVNDERYEEECLKYLNALVVPDGYVLEQMSVRDAKSMTAGYNEAMQASNAKYKIYIHQDVFITNKNLLQNILEIFNDESIGLVGMVGCENLPESAVMWEGDRIGRTGTCGINNSGDRLFEISPVQGRIRDVAAVDGFFIATQVDVPWREDIFDGWDFYDVSQCFEMKRNGLRVVVPDMSDMWAIHDDGVLNLESYYKYRDVFLKEYYEKVSSEKIDDSYAIGRIAGKEAVAKIDEILATKTSDTFKQIAQLFTPDFCNECVAKSGKLLNLYVILSVIAHYDFENKEEMFKKCYSIDELIGEWTETKFAMWEVETSLDENAEKRFYDYICQRQLSDCLLDKLIDTSAMHAREMRMVLACIFMDNGDTVRARKYI